MVLNTDITYQCFIVISFTLLHTEVSDLHTCKTISRIRSLSYKKKIIYFTYLFSSSVFHYFTIKHTNMKVCMLLELDIYLTKYKGKENAIN